MNQMTFIIVSIFLFLGSQSSFAQSIEKINFNKQENRLFSCSYDQVRWLKAKTQYAKVVARLVADYPAVSCEKELSSGQHALTSECFHFQDLDSKYHGYFLDHWKKTDLKMIALLSSLPSDSEHEEVGVWLSALVQEVKFLSSLAYESAVESLDENEGDELSLRELNRSEFEKHQAKGDFQRRWFIQKHIPRYGTLRPKSDRDLKRMGTMKPQRLNFTQAELREMGNEDEVEFDSEEYEELLFSRAMRQLNVVRGSDELPEVHSLSSDLGADSVFISHEKE